MENFQQTEAADQVLREYGRLMQLNRLTFGLSLREASNRAGVSKNTIHRVESGYRVRRQSLNKICRAYGCVTLDQVGGPDSGMRSESYSVQESGQAMWYLSRRDQEGRHVVETREAIQDPNERSRLGRYGFASHFGQPLRCRRAGSRFIPFLLEIHSSTDVSSDPSGERFMYVIRGEVEVLVGDIKFPLREGGAATIDATLPHGFRAVGEFELAPLVLEVVIP